MIDNSFRFKCAEHISSFLDRLYIYIYLNLYLYTYHTEATHNNLKMRSTRTSLSSDDFPRQMTKFKWHSGLVLDLIEWWVSWKASTTRLPDLLSSYTHTHTHALTHLYLSTYIELQLCLCICMRIYVSISTARRLHNGNVLCFQFTNASVLPSQKPKVD